MSREMKAFIGSLLDDNGYDFLCGYANDLTKDEIVDIAKELLYTIHVIRDTDAVMADEALKYAAKELIDRYEE